MPTRSSVRRTARSPFSTPTGSSPEPVTTIGPRFRDAHELPLDVVDRADAIATDSLPQVDAYDRPYVASGDDRERMVELADVLENPDLGRQRADDITLFCSVGLAGTEVVLGTTFLERFA